MHSHNKAGDGSRTEKDNQIIYKIDAGTSLFGITEEYIEVNRNTPMNMWVWHAVPTTKKEIFLETKDLIESSATIRIPRLFSGGVEQSHYNHIFRLPQNFQKIVMIAVKRQFVRQMYRNEI